MYMFYIVCIICRWVTLVISKFDYETLQRNVNQQFFTFSSIFNRDFFFPEKMIVLTSLSKKYFYIGAIIALYREKRITRQRSIFFLCRQIRANCQRAFRYNDFIIFFSEICIPVAEFLFKWIIKNYWMMRLNLSVYI